MKAYAGTVAEMVHVKRRAGVSDERVPRQTGWTA